MTRTVAAALLLALGSLPAVAQDIFLEKSTNGQDADAPPGPVVLAGDPVDWAYFVTAGPRDIENIVVTDDQGVPVSCPQAALPAGGSMTCTASGTATVGQYANVGTVEADFVVNGQPVVPASDPSHYFGVAEIAITLEKSTEGFDADAPPGPTLAVGTTVNWTYLVTNTSSTDTLSNVGVADDQGVVVSCPQSTLTPGESMTCTGSGTAQPGQYANLGTATGELPGPVEVLANDPSHYRGQQLSFEKRTNGVDADVPPGPAIPVGDSVAWTYEVANPGPGTVSGIAVIDDQGVVVSCPQSSLDAGESMTCTANGVATLGPYSNLGTVDGELPGGAPVSASDPSHYVGFLPNAIVVEKSTNGLDADAAPGPVVAVGVPISWTYEVTNPGLDPIANIVVTDDQGVAVSCPQSTLAGGESMTCTASGTSVAGQYENLGTVDGELPGPTPVTDSDLSHYFGQDQILDWGDAPDPAYPTSLGSTGASHVLGSSVYLGACVDSELDGQPSALADGDDGGSGGTTSGSCAVPGDDEDGVTFLDPLISGATVDIEVVVNDSCTLTAWIDFDVDGDWDSPADDLFPGGVALVAGLNALSFTVPVDAVGGETFARFRCTTDTPPEGGAFGPTGQAADGEVEDYRLEIELDLEATLVDSPGTPAMPGDTVSYRADVTSLAGSAKGLQLDLTLDPNMALAGGVTTTPLALDDGPYVGDPSVPTTVDGVEQPLLLANDFGIPMPTAIATVGQSTALGGSVDVAADGSFTYTPPPGAVGGEVDSFTYDAENGIPPASPATDTATAVIVLGAAPQAVDDDADGQPAYSVAAGGTLTVPDGPGDPVERNDSLGSPPATLSHFGGGDLGGSVTDNGAGATVTPLPGFGDGSLTVNADGSFVFVAPTGLTGTWSFDYRLTNPNGTSDATVTIEVQIPPDAIDDGPAPGSAPDDPFHIDVGEVLDTTTHATPPVLDNDDLGIPPGAVTFYGTSSMPTTEPAEGNPTATDQGGTVQVATGGDFVYTPPAPPPPPLGRGVGGAFVGYDAFGYVLGNPGGSDAAVVTIAVGAPAVCTADSYDALGNVQIEVPAASGALSNDSGDQIVVSTVEGDGANVGVATATDQSGTVTLDADGSLTYTSAPGFQGADTFQYTAGNGFGDSSECTVTITVDETIWFVDNTASGGGDGTQASPFDSLANYDAGAADGAGDIVFLFEGDGTTSGYDTGITLLASQLLVGQGVDLVTTAGVTVPPFATPLPGPAGRPQLTHGSGVGVTLASGNGVHGLDVVGTSGAGMSGSAVGTATVGNVDIIDSGGPALAINGGTLAMTFGTLDSLNSSGHGIDLQSVGGSLTVTTTTAQNPTDAGIRVTNALGGAAFSFGTTSVTNAGDTVAGADAGVDLSASAGASFTFASLSVSSENGAGLRASSAGTLTVGGTTNTAAATSGAALDLASTAIGTLTFSALSSSNSSGRGIDLASVTGSLTATAVSVTGAAGTAVRVSGGAPTVSLTGTVTQNSAQRVVDIENTTGGATSFTGTVTGGAASLGVRIHNADGNVSFSDLDLGTSGAPLTSTALTLSGGSTGTFTFAGAQIFTSGASGVDADNGGVVQVTGAGNRVTTTNGVAVALLGGTTIGPSEITFERVDASGSTHGIRLDGAGSGFTITGVGTTDGSGGTISNVSQRGIEILGTDDVSLANVTLSNASTADAAGNCDGLVNSGCNAAIHLGTVTGATLDNLDISTSTQIGLNGTTVSGLNLQNSSITSCGDEVNEGCLQVFGLTGTSDITSSDISFPAERAAYVRNSGAGNLVLTVSDSTFRDTQSSGLGADGLEATFFSTATATIDVVDSSFLRNRTNGLQVLAQGSSVVGVDVTGSTFDREAGIGIGLDLAANDSAQLTFNVIGNPVIYSRGSSAVNVFADGPSTVQGRINDNPDIQAGGGTTSGFGIRAQSNSDARMILEISGNTIGNIGFDAGIETIARLLSTGPCGTSCTAGRLDVTIDNNNVTVDAVNSLYDIWVQASDDNTTCANVANNTASGVAIAAFRERTAAANSTVLLEGFMTDATTTWNNNGNTPAGSVSSSNNGTLAGATCVTVSHPLP